MSSEVCSSRLDDDERFATIISNDSAETSKSKLSFVNEAGLHSLILSSRKSEVKRFVSGGVFALPDTKKLQNNFAVSNCKSDADMV